MARLLLDGHYGQRVEIDRCGPCHLVWFDSVESVRLAGTGMLALLRDMAEAQREPHSTLKADARCPLRGLCRPRSRGARPRARGRVRESFRSSRRR
jgi:Zn-finger nucleic acid-binding protein